MSNTTINHSDEFPEDLWNKFRYGCVKAQPQDCLARPDVILADSGIAGIGVCIGFQISALLAITLTAITTVVDFRHHHKGEGICKRRMFLEKLVLSLSNSQVVTGLCILIAGYNKECSLSVYHFNIVNDLVLMSTVTHAFSLIVLPKYFRAHPWLAVLRVVIILAIGVFALRSAFWGRFMVAGRDPNVGWPASCYLNSDLRKLGTVPNANNTNIIGLTFVVVTILVLVFALASFMIRFRQLVDRLGRFAWALRVCIQGVVPFGTFCFSTWKLWWDRQYLSTTSQPVRLFNGDQDRWYFGQLLTIFMLGMVLMTAMEAWPTTFDRQQTLDSMNAKQNMLSYDRLKTVDDEIALTGTRHRGHSPHTPNASSPYIGSSPYMGSPRASGQIHDRHS